MRKASTGTIEGTYELSLHRFDYAKSTTSWLIRENGRIIAEGFGSDDADAIRRAANALTSHLAIEAVTQ